MCGCLQIKSHARAVDRGLESEPVAHQGKVLLFGKFAVSRKKRAQDSDPPPGTLGVRNGMRTRQEAAEQRP